MAAQRVREDLRVHEALLCASGIAAAQIITKTVLGGLLIRLMV